MKNKKSLVIEDVKEAVREGIKRGYEAGLEDARIASENLLARIAVLEAAETEAEARGRAAKTLEDACEQTGHLLTKCACRVTGAVHDEMDAYQKELARQRAEEVSSAAKLRRSERGKMISILNALVAWIRSKAKQ